MLLKSQDSEGICKSDNFIENIYGHVFMIFNDRVKMLQLKCVYPMCDYGRFANELFRQRSVRQRLESICQRLESICQRILPTGLYCITLLYTIIYCHIKGSVI